MRTNWRAWVWRASWSLAACLGLGGAMVIEARSDDPPNSASGGSASGGSASGGSSGGSGRTFGSSGGSAGGISGGSSSGASGGSAGGSSSGGSFGGGGGNGNNSRSFSRSSSTTRSSRSGGGSKSQKSPGERSPNDETQNDAADVTTREEQVSVRRVGSRRITNVQSDDRSIVITESPSRITINLIDSENDPPTHKTFAAPNAEALKSKHPEGYELYREYVLEREVGGAGAGAAAGGRGDVGNEAQRLLNEQLDQALKQADSPELRRLIEEARREVNK